MTSSNFARLTYFFSVLVAATFSPSLVAVGQAQICPLSEFYESRESMKSLPGLQLPDIEEGPVPCIRVLPIYPRLAAWGEVSGCVKLAYDVDVRGHTDGVRVIQSYPQGVFDRAGTNALKRWRFYPQQVQGRSVSTSGNEVVLTFVLEYDDDEEPDPSKLVRLFYSTFSDFDPQLDPFAACPLPEAD